ncbi:hypothetical protein C4K36_4116 [Pseudomonas chlororaphis subsp. piscium]|nr:hypothetical protein C4K36_4116 [Pseudomonas chlororaphis subsp. piscium]
MAAVWLGSEHGDDGTVIIRNPVHYGKPVPTTVTKDRSRWLRVNAYAMDVSASWFSDAY